MSVLEQKKREEGDEHVRQAEKHLKTSPLKFKFSPDWDPAGDEFSKAATCYKVAKNYEESKVFTVHCKKRLSIFPSPAGVSLTKLSLAGINLIIHGQGEFSK
jgi:hypothetical protein